MSETINGSKSSLYIKDAIPGIENSIDQLTHQSVQDLWSSRGAADVLIHAVYATTAIPFTIESGSVRRLIKITGHGASAGDFIRMNNGAAESEEVTILKIVDADFFVIAKEINAVIGDEVFILKSVTPTYNQDGSLNVSNGPVQFIKDAVVQQVTEDTVVPANNEPLPSKMFIEIDGVMYPVRKDTVTPSNSVLVPVEVSGVSGPINITAGDLNVQLSDLGANFDRTRIGNGTNQWDMNAAGEGLVHDADSLAELVDINTELDTQTTALGDINTELNTQTISLSSIDTKLSSQATAAKQDLLLAELQLKADLTETQPVSIAGTVAVSGPLTDAQLRATPVPVSLAGSATAANQATEIASLASIDGKTPTLGQALAAASVPVVLTALQLASITPPAAITGFALETTQTAGNVLIGSVTETAPASDTASSGLNGRLQRIAQNISALILQLPATLGIKTAANSLSVAPASDAIFNTKGKALTSSFAEFLTLTTVQTFTAPANAIGGLIQASDANLANVRFKQGGIATITSGLQLQAGRSEQIGSGTDVSVVSESGTNAVSIIWNIQA